MARGQNGGSCGQNFCLPVMGKTEVCELRAHDNGLKRRIQRSCSRVSGTAQPRAAPIAASAVLEEKPSWIRVHAVVTVARPMQPRQCTPMLSPLITRRARFATKL